MAEASAEYGLSSEQVRERREAGLENTAVEAATKTVGQIIAGNVCTYFNLLFFLLALCVASVKAWLDLTFMGVIVVNTVIGIVQELRSKRTLDQLRILTEQKLHVIRDGREQSVEADALVRDDIVRFGAGDQICADAQLLSGQLQVNEALVTGEADEIEKQPGDTLLSGSFAVAGNCVARLTAVGSESFAARLTLEAKQHGGPRLSEMMRSLSRLVKVIGILVIPLGIALFVKDLRWLERELAASVTSTVAAVIGMIPEGLYLLTSLALVAGILRLARRRTLSHDMASIETLARVDVLCVDKTGTVTENKMTVEELSLLREDDFPESEVRALLADYVFAQPADNETMQALKKRFQGTPRRRAERTLPFSSARKYGGVDFGGGECWLLGAPEVLLKLDYREYQERVEHWAEKGCRVLLLAQYGGALTDETPEGRLKPVALVLLSNKLRREAEETFRYFAEQGVEIKVISGDNPVTVSEIARQAGIANAERWVDARELKGDAEIQSAATRYTVFGRVTPEQKRKLVIALKKAGHTVAMTGDGVNDVLALKEADCGVAMASGSDAACRAANIVLLNSDFSNMPGVVQEGRRVINNIERSAALYLVKNMFSFSLALITLFFALPYPFSPAGLSLVNGLTIGLPSFVLAMEPNHQRITGRFLPNVILRALPAALTDLLLILGVLLFYSVLQLPEEGAKTVATGVMGIVGLMMVHRTCRPYTPVRRILMLFCALAFAFSFLFLKVYFTLPGLGKADILILAVFALLAKPAMEFFQSWLDRIRSWITSRREDLDL